MMYPLNLIFKIIKLKNLLINGCDQITIGRKNYSTLMENIKILRSYVITDPNITTYSSLREENHGSAYRVGKDEILLILAIKIFSPYQDMIPTYGYADEDADLSNMNPPRGYRQVCRDDNNGKMDFKFTSAQSGILETKFSIPSGKYPCISIQGDGVVFVNVYCYVENL